MKPSGNWKKTILRVLIPVAVFLAVCVLIGMFVDLPVHKTLKQWNIKDSKSRPIEFVRNTFDFFNCYVRPAAIVLLLWTCLLAGVKTEKWRFIFQVVLGVAITAIPVWLFGKCFLPRCRPRFFDGAAWLESFGHPTFHISDMRMQSFPSGDAALAFLLSAILAHHFPRYRVILYILAVGCACNRVLTEYHWVSDVLIGAVIGFLIGKLVLVLTGDIRTGT